MTILVLNGKVCKSRWDKDSTIGRLRVIATPAMKYRGYKEGKTARRLWHYICRCACGEIEELHQEQLALGRETCTKCLKKPGPKIAHAEIAPRDPTIPDFARLPAPSLAKRPDQ